MLWCECGGVSMCEPGGLNGVSVLWCGGVSVMCEHVSAWWFECQCVSGVWWCECCGVSVVV